MGQCISKKTDQEFVVRYDPTSSTRLYKHKQSGIINFFKNKFWKNNRKYIEVINIDTTVYKDFTNDKIVYI